MGSIGSAAETRGHRAPLWSVSAMSASTAFRVSLESQLPRKIVMVMDTGTRKAVVTNDDTPSYSRV